MAEDRTQKLKDMAKSIDRNVSTFAFTDSPEKTKDLTKIREISGRFAVKAEISDNDIRELRRIEVEGKDKSLSTAAKNMLEIAVAHRVDTKKAANEPSSEKKMSAKANKVTQPSSPSEMKSTGQEPDVVSKGHGTEEQKEYGPETNPDEAGTGEFGEPMPPKNMPKPTKDDNTVDVVGEKDKPKEKDNKWLMAALAGLASSMMSKDKIDKEKSTGMIEATKMMYSPWTGMKGDTVVPSSYAGNMASNMTNFLALYQNYLKSKSDTDSAEAEAKASKAKEDFYLSGTPKK